MLQKYNDRIKNLFFLKPQKDLVMLKKLTLVALLMAYILPSYAQDDKGIKFGLHTTPGISFMGSNDSRVNSAGNNASLGLGVEMEYYFIGGEKVAVTFGLDYTLGKGGLLSSKYGGTMFANSDEVFDLSLYTMDTSFTMGAQDIPPTPTQALVDSANLDFAAFSRYRYAANYIEIPFGVKFRPAEFGDFRIFVHLPIVRLMIATSARTKIYAPSSEVEGFVEDMYGYRPTDGTVPRESIYNDINFIQVAAGGGLGAEWAPNDQLRVFAGLYYEAAMLDMTKKVNVRLEQATDEEASTFLDNPEYLERNPRTAPHNIGLRVGVVFVP